MDFSTLFRTKENLNLDKSTLTILRYIAITGQFIAINVVFFYLNLEFPIKASLIVVFIGLLTNLYLQFKVKANQLKDTYASLFLLYDLFQYLKKFFCRKSFPTDDPEWEEMQKQKARTKQREADLENLHNSMFG